MFIQSHAKLQSWRGRHKNCGSFTTRTSAGIDDCVSSHCGHWCCCCPYWCLSQAVTVTAQGWYLGRLWSRKELQTLQHQCSVHQPWHKKVTSTTNASRAISGCDTTSAFWGTGKKSFWQAWMAFEEVTDTFVYLASHPFEPLDSNCENFRKIERLIVLVYDKTSTSLSINQTRRELFCLKNITMERMPPMQKALLQHEEGYLPSFYLDYKYRSTADDSFPKRLWLETSRQCVEPTLANCSRAF